MTLLTDGDLRPIIEWCSEPRIGTLPLVNAAGAILIRDPLSEGRGWKRARVYEGLLAHTRSRFPHKNFNVFPAHFNGTLRASDNPLLLVNVGLHIGSVAWIGLSYVGGPPNGFMLEVDQLSVRDGGTEWPAVSFVHGASDYTLQLYRAIAYLSLEVLVEEPYQDYERAALNDTAACVERAAEGTAEGDAS